MEGFAIGGRIIHTQNSVALSLVTSLSGSHEDAAANGQIRVVQQMSEELVSVADRLVSLVHNTEVKTKIG